MSRRRPRRRKSSPLNFQKQEPRCLLAGITFDAASGVVTVDGSAAADYVQVADQGEQISVSLSDHGQQLFAKSEVTRVDFIGKAGNDWFRNLTSVSSRAYGQGGDDILIGGNGEDRLRGGPGNDSLRGEAGDDFLGGDTGDDYLEAGSGKDRVVGSDGNDRLFGGDGDDSLFGGEGDDYARGGSGSDRLFGFNGNDQLFGDSGDDVIAGQNGDDILFGDDGADSVFGNDGHDIMDGGNDDDWLAGGNGDDRITGQRGRDRIFGQFGDDWLGGGDDDDVISGDDGNDDIYAGNGDDTVYAGNGLDRLYGQDGQDSLDGGNGQDDLSGGRHADRLHGGSGNDDFVSDSSDLIEDDSDDYSAFGDFEVRGNITGLDEAAMTFTLLGIQVDYARAELRGPLAEGDYVKVEGTFFDNLLTAHEVEPEDESSQDDNYEARGNISNLDESAQTFQFNGFAVQYANAQVETTLANGAFVKVEGRLIGDTVTAHEIENESGDDHQDGQEQTDGQLELRGRMENFDSATKSFTLLGIPVDFASAEIQGVLGNGAFVKVEGFYDGNEINAREVQLELEEDRDENFRGRGVIENLDSDAMQFDFLGFQVNYSRAKLDGLPAEGDSVEIRGWFENFAITAEEIRS